jgi:hypothetical protein
MLDGMGGWTAWVAADLFIISAEFQFGKPANIAGLVYLFPRAMFG